MDAVAVSLAVATALAALIDPALLIAPAILPTAAAAAGEPRAAAAAAGAAAAAAAAAAAVAVAESTASLARVKEPTQQEPPVPTTMPGAGVGSRLVLGPLQVGCGPLARWQRSGLRVDPSLFVVLACEGV